MVVLAYFFENLFSVMTGMVVPLPVIHRVAKCTQPMLLNGLAKSKVSLAPVGAEFHDQTRFQSYDQVAGKGKMSRPLTHISRFIAAGQESRGRQAAGRSCLSMLTRNKRT